MMSFRQQLAATLRAARSILEVPGVMVVGSEVPNLLEAGAASTLVVSRDVDIGVPVDSHARVRERLPSLVGFRRCDDEPSVWTPAVAGLLEVRFVGVDPSIRDPMDTYVLEDRELPLLVFGPLGLLTPGDPVLVEGVTIPVPRIAGLVLEKLLTDRTAEKGARCPSVAGIYHRLHLHGPGKRQWN
jgi:hypothetical protein